MHRSYVFFFAIIIHCCSAYAEIENVESKMGQSFDDEKQIFADKLNCPNETSVKTEYSRNNEGFHVSAPFQGAQEMYCVSPNGKKNGPYVYRKYIREELRTNFYTYKPVLEVWGQYNDDKRVGKWFRKADPNNVSEFVGDRLSAITGDVTLLKDYKTIEEQRQAKEKKLVAKKEKEKEQQEQMLKKLKEKELATLAHQKKEEEAHNNKWKVAREIIKCGESLREIYEPTGECKHEVLRHKCRHRFWCEDSSTKRQGHTAELDDNNRVTVRGSFKDNLKHGDWEFIDSEDITKSVFLDGKRNGLTTVNRADGTKKLEIDYKDDLYKSVKSFDQKGKPIPNVFVCSFFPAIGNAVNWGKNSTFQSEGGSDSKEAVETARLKAVSSCKQKICVQQFRTAHGECIIKDPDA